MVLIFDHLSLCVCVCIPNSTEFCGRNHPLLRNSCRPFRNPRSPSAPPRSHSHVILAQRHRSGLRGLRSCSAPSSSHGAKSAPLGPMAASALGCGPRKLYESLWIRSKWFHHLYGLCRKQRVRIMRGCLNAGVSSLRI